MPHVCHPSTKRALAKIPPSPCMFAAHATEHGDSEIQAVRASLAGMTTMTPLGFVRARNLMTYASVACALLATAYASGPNGPARAGALLALAALADLVDGRFARLFPSDDAQRRFGVQIDSLADAVTFGFAPIMCLDRTGAFDGPFRPAFLGCALVYALAALTRLGFYNIVDDAAGFVGMPTTIAGIAWSALFFVTPGSWIAGALVVLAVLMVAPLRVKRPGATFMIALIVACLVLAGAHGRRAL